MLRPKIMFGIFILLCVGVLILGWISIANFEKTALPRVYSSENGEYELEYHNSKYSVNGERVLYEGPGLKNSLVTFLSPPVGIPFLLAFVIIFIVIPRLNLPPTYLLKVWFQNNEEEFELPSLLKPNSQVTGIIAFRGWHYGKGALRSLAVDIVWETNQLVSDRMPVKGDYHGIYAHRLGVGNGDLGAVCGVVSLSGNILGHGDNILRAEKCRILCLLTSKPGIVDELKRRYLCPVYVVKDKKKAISQFTISKDGIHWLQHNNKVIDQNKVEV